ncbi:hypothetical protein HII31_12970 [Pseudocercospora fuligena]|uniref:Apple domain-containing protein n=1 Tax=Pseudocercospora fuligena TaxID=685502 RepID=A0A8H6R5Z1_9PEZI|nr:hypothetical protein HII31_12970 [Pseudocercospora fuligena]
MALLAEFLVLLISCLGATADAQTNPAVITRTVFSTCAHTSRSLPSEGWISTNGSTLPYTFNTPITYYAPNSTVAGISTTTRSSTTAPTCRQGSSLPISCPRSNATVYVPPDSCDGIRSNGSYITFCDENYEGVELGALADVPVAEDCIAECSRDNECRAVSYDTFQRSCTKKTNVTLQTRRLEPNVVFSFNLTYFVALELQQPIQPMPENTLPSTAPWSTTVTTTSTSSPSPTLSTPMVISTIATSISNVFLNTYVRGGTPVVTVFGGNTITYAFDGVATATVRGGLTTTYTTGGTTEVRTETTQGAVATPSIVSEAAVGACPAYNGRVYNDMTTNGSYVVACGSTYRGSISSVLARRQLQSRAAANECIFECQALGECKAFSYSGDRCTLYSEISGQLDSVDPAFSGVRIRVEEDDTSDVSITPAGTTQPTDTEVLISTILSVSTITSVVPASTITSILPASTFTVISSLPERTTTAVQVLVSTEPARTTTVIQPPQTSTILVTYTYFSAVPASTLVSTERFTYTSISNRFSTIISTQIVVSTLVSISAASTEIVTISQAASSYTYTTTFTSNLPASTIISTERFTTSLDGTTFISTERITSTLPASTVLTTATITTTENPSPLISTIIRTPPAETVISTLPAVITTFVETYTTREAPSIILQTTTIVSTPPASTIVSTAISIMPPSTIVSTYLTNLEASTVVYPSSAPGQTTTALFTTIEVSTALVTLVSTLEASTLIYYITQTVIPPAVTFTPLPETQTVLSIPPAETLTERITTISIPAAETFTQPTIIISTLAAPTLTEQTTIVSTLLTTDFVNITQTLVPPASTTTEQTTIVSTLLTTNLINITETLIPPVSTTTEQTTIVSTLPTTEFVSITETLIPPASTTTQPTTLITTQLTTVYAPASTVTESTTVVSTQSAIFYGATTCTSSNDGQIYVAEDGSRWTMTCGSGTTFAWGGSQIVYQQDPEHGYEYNIMRLTVPPSSFSDCIEHCSSQGTRCMGITWQGTACALLRRVHGLHRSEVPRGTARAVRISGSAGANSSQLLQNPALDTTDSWFYWNVLDSQGNGGPVLNNDQAAYFCQNVYYCGNWGYLSQTLVAKSGSYFTLSFKLAIDVSKNGQVPDDYIFYAPPDVSILFGTYYGDHPVSEVRTVSDINQTTVYFSGILLYPTTDIKVFPHPSFVAARTTIDDINFYTFDPSEATKALPVGPITLVSGASFAYTDLATETYRIPEVFYTQVSTISTRLRITLPDLVTQCRYEVSYVDYQSWAAYGYSTGIEYSIMASTLTTSGETVVSGNFAPEWSTQDLFVSFFCSGSGGSVLEVFDFNLTTDYVDGNYESYWNGIRPLEV